jgi:hypothetical protein
MTTAVNGICFFAFARIDHSILRKAAINAISSVTKFYSSRGKGRRKPTLDGLRLAKMQKIYRFGTPPIRVKRSKRIKCCGWGAVG